MKKKNKYEDLWTAIIILFVFAVVLLAGLFYFKPYIEGTSADETSEEESFAPTPSAASEEDPVLDLTACTDVTLPAYGDLGGVCSQEGNCEVDGDVCSHYWDYANKQHECACVESNFCGQYCYEYLYTTGCVCPPNSEQQWITRSTFVCVPDGYFCENGEIMEEVGPFPE